ncbi:XRE family transcriptional regulator [Candidatus Babeliales bacterium]|nr:XRE family transcriptional regulator [Candidatus Babeliales bacterium]MBY0352937.1 XRE family transcriptional regulator [Candidatus Babeliales bacterium]
MSSTELRVKELLRERGWTTKVLAEKTGMSESYLTHIKNGTRRWNEDALKKLANAFDIHPVDLFAQRRSRTDNVDTTVKIPETTAVDLQLKIVPVMGDIPSNPSPYNNQLTQVTTGYKDIFVPVFNSSDDSMFCLNVESNAMAPTFVKGDYLIISPETWTRSGDIAAVEYGNENPIKGILQVTYMEDFIVLESVNHKHPPVALIRGKDNFRVVGKVTHRYQKLS